MRPLAMLCLTLSVMMAIVQLNKSLPLTNLPNLRSFLWRLGVDIFATSDIIRWHDSISQQIPPVPVHTSLVSIHGKTVNAVAACILDLIIHLEKRHSIDEPFVMEDQELQAAQIIKCKTDIVFESFLREYRSISMSVARSASSRFLYC
ncbi:hypothetical protein MVEN_01328300 [Mycena venus]|uniref:Uncharacterized protein n=1 Tax=Mycena venus TaxID=2733690 RepID=A0A8H7CWU0_9AGAR|nr:hypothetical protein MVEN_01328300 [Mycena venus]